MNMTLAELNPHVRYIGNHIVENTPGESSMCYDCRIFYVTEGSGYVLLDNKQKLLLSKNNIMFFPPNTKYKFIASEKDERFKLLVVDFDLTAEHISRVKSLGFASESTFIKEKVSRCKTPNVLKNTIIRDYIPEVSKFLLKSEQLFIKKELDYRAFVSSYIKLSLIHICHGISISHKALDVITSVKEYINTANLTDLTNSKIAEKFHYHPHYLSKLIKEETGYTLNQYIINVKIEKAKLLLSSTDFSVEEIAWKSYFQSTSYFIKMFKKLTGKTPKQYRLGYNYPYF